MKILVTVKAYPGLGRTDGETVCVAGVSLDGDRPSWVRLWPVGFRELEASIQFKKWQIIEVEGQRSTRDTRPESYRPNLETLKLGQVIDSSKGWSKRRELIGSLLGETTLCELQRAQAQRSAPSMGLVKVRPGATASIIDGPVWAPERELLAQIAAAPHLYRTTALAPLRAPDYQVSYKWHCMDTECNGHTQASCDWEVGAAAINLGRNYPDVRPHLLENFGKKMLGPNKDTYFFVGNQHQRPQTFMVLGAFYPPA